MKLMKFKKSIIANEINVLFWLVKHNFSFSELMSELMSKIYEKILVNFCAGQRSRGLFCLLGARK